MERKYAVYRITAPTGRSYTGMTSTSLKDRWRAHVRRALVEMYEHPFYAAIRQFGPDCFAIEIVAENLTQHEAQNAEEKYIAETPPQLSYNISPGARHDAKTGSRVFWSAVRQDKHRLDAYLKTLSATKLKDDWSDYKTMSDLAQQWRGDNPKQAYKNSTRASRIAARGKAKPPTPELPLKERLLRKHKPGVLRSERVAGVWAKRSDAQRADVGARISESLREVWAAMPEEERNTKTAEARKHIDRNKQGKAASKGLKAWWASLKADPVRYAAHLAARKETLAKKKAQSDAS